MSGKESTAPVIDNYLKNSLMHDEGFSLKPYKDSRGVWTIGIGHNLQTHEITHQQAMDLFEEDIADVVGWMSKYSWYGKLDPLRKNVVLNMGFELGQTRFSKFKKFIAFLEADDTRSASCEMLLSDWAHECAARAIRLSREMATGEPFLYHDTV